MTMLTSCAHCATAFRVTSEQLVAHQGKVRCGTCNTVFSALENLIHTSPEALLADANSNTGAAAVDTASAPAFSVASLASPDTTSATLVVGAAPVAPVDGDRTVPLPTQPAGMTMAAVPPEMALPEPAASLEDVPAPESQSSTSPDAAAIPPDPPTPVLPLLPSIPATPVAPPAGFAWWSAAAALVALGCLALQGAYFYRNELVTHVPETKPALAALCQQLGCTFAAPRDAQAITIESHDLQAEPANKNILALIALLRNRATFAQDAPHLELTLTDAQDAALARRVFLPREYVTAAQMAPNSELPVRIMVEAGQIKAAGYRLYAFYP